MKMIKKLPFALLANTMIAAVCLAVDISQMPWNEQQLGVLKTLGKPSVAEFLTSINGNFSGHGDCSCVKKKDIGDFGWFDLGNDGRLELVTTLDVNGRSFFNAFMIYRQDAPGKISFEEIRGWNIGRLSKVVRDLNGDGREELVIPTPLPPDNWAPTVDTPAWPKVYRFDGQRYVDASASFPDFYDREVLPVLESRIEKTKKVNSEQSQNQYSLALLVLTKDHILHVLGRGLTGAEQEEAREANAAVTHHTELLRNGSG
jgi:hypothetical protein